YALFGPVYETPGKGPPLGLAGLHLAAAAGGGIPVYALGGVTLEKLGEISAAGAAGIAGIRIFQWTAQLPALVAAAVAAFPGGLTLVDSNEPQRSAVTPRRP
ncbi:MAG TPA: thiamine phosphate synthase, partial [Thermoanaerobaculia bacterium]|nr:thiamine phosphate synthase [Thermoanaerobaculia bacterium]